jgi:hypothetical protein
MNKLISERDYAAQEVCYLLLSLLLKQSSPTPIYVDMRPLAAQPSLVRVEDGEARCGFSILEHYVRRPKDFDDVSYLKFLLSYKH